MSYGILNGAGGLGETAPLVTTGPPQPRPIPTPVLYIGGAALLGLIVFAVCLHLTIRFTTPAGLQPRAEPVVKHSGAR